MEPHQRLVLYLGERSLDEADWEPVEDQKTFGIELSNENPDSAVGWEIGVMVSKETGSIFIPSLGLFIVEG
jgi:hypothetical protein